MRATLVMADDHRLVAEALAGLLETQYELLGVAENGWELIEKVKSCKPDVAIVDISMPLLNGIEAVRKLQECCSKTKIIFLSMHSDATYVTEAMRAGASGYVLKRCAVAEVPKAIAAVLRGEVYISPLVPQAALTAAGDSQRDVLTVRQREVLQLIAEGKSAKEVAGVLNVSVKTAEFHRASIMDRLGLRTTAELTKYAMEHGLTAGV